MSFQVNRHMRFVVAFGVGIVILTAGTGQVHAQDGNLPKGETLVETFVKATTGTAKTVVMKGNLGVAGAGIAGDIVIQTKAPNQMHMIMNLPQLGKTEAGSDGKTSWMIDPISGPKLTDPKDIQDALPGLDITTGLDWKKLYKSIKTESEEKLNGKDVYKVKLENQKGEVETWYFDKTSGLLSRMKKTLKSKMGNLPVDLDFSEYKKVGDMEVPHLLTVGMILAKMEIRFTSVEVNVNLPESTFALPESIKELLKKKEQPK